MSTPDSVIASIKELQQMEKKLIDNFPKGSIAEEEAALIKMQELTTMRVNLFNMIKNNYTQEISQTTSDLESQLGTLRMVESELQVSKNQLHSLEQQRVDRMRMAEINTYYSEKYKAYNELLKIIIICAIPIAIIMYVGNLNVIPEKYVSKQNSQDIFLILLLVALGISLYFILNKMYDIKKRNNMNFNEYDFSNDARYDEAVELSEYREAEDGGILNYNASEFERLAKEANLGCVDSYCCADGTMYDSLKKMCIPIMRTNNQNNQNAALASGSFSSPNSEIMIRDYQNKMAEPTSDNNVPFASV